MCGEIQRCMSTSDCVVHHSEIYCRGMEEGSGPGEARGGHVDEVPDSKGGRNILFRENSVHTGTELTTYSVHLRMRRNHEYLRK